MTREEQIKRAWGQTVVDLIRECGNAVVPVMRPLKPYITDDAAVLCSKHQDTTATFVGELEERLDLRTGIVWRWYNVTCEGIDFGRVYLECSTGSLSE